MIEWRWLIFAASLIVNPLALDDRVFVLEWADAFAPAAAFTQPKHVYCAGNIMQSNRLDGYFSSTRSISNSTDVLTSDDKERCRKVLTSAVLKIAYDGTHFCGWTGSTHRVSTRHNSQASHDGSNRKQSRRSRTLQRKGSGFTRGEGSIRTVEQALKISLAKVYGNIPTEGIMFDSCSRTDKGVHATSLVVQFYCLACDREDFDIDSPSNNTWARLRPNSSTDTNFLPLPFDSNLSKLVFVLNRMLPPDVRVVAASPAPEVPKHTPIRSSCENDVLSGKQPNVELSFHPTLHVKSKTYTYQFAVGPIQDPLRSDFIWHLDGSSQRAVGMNGQRFCLKRAIKAANVFVEQIQPRDYSAFRSAFRGNERRRAQSPVCTIWKCELVREPTEILPSWDPFSGNKSINLKHGSRLSDVDKSFVAGSTYDPVNVGTYTFVITGDRFLYKMVRNIVGAIVAAACGHIEVDDIRNSLTTPAHDDDSVRRICAPARGLALCNVEFPESIVFDWQTG
jgi:tRNA U38,U39,U40 pseudouridine synthase TruA